MATSGSDMRAFLQSPASQTSARKATPGSGEKCGRTLGKRKSPPSRRVTRNMTKARKQTAEDYSSPRVLAKQQQEMEEQELQDKHHKRREQCRCNSDQQATPVKPLDDSFGDDSPEHIEAARIATKLPECEKIQVNSLLLSAQSPFFRRLFNAGGYGVYSGPTVGPGSGGAPRGFKEHGQHVVDIQLHPRERTTFRLLIKFMYSDIHNCQVLSDSMSAQQILDFLFMADRFSVASAVCKALEFLGSKILNVECCERFLHLPENIRTHPAAASAYQHLYQNIQQHLVSVFEDFDRVSDGIEFLSLSSEALKLVLCSSDLHVRSENTVWRALTEWLCHDNERTLTSGLIECVRFPRMRVGYLLDVLCRDKHYYENARVRARVQEAIAFHASLPQDARRDIMAEKGGILYEARQESFSRIHTFSSKFTRAEIRNLAVGRPIYSERFYVDGYEFLLKLRKVPSQGTFGVYLGSFNAIGRKESRLQHLEVSARFSFHARSRSQSDGDWKALHRQVSHTFRPRPGYNTSWGYNDIFSLSWEQLFDPFCEYFVDDMLSMRVDVEVIDPLPVDQANTPGL
eukprot:846972_1